MQFFAGFHTEFAGNCRCCQPEDSNVVMNVSIRKFHLRIITAIRIMQFNSNKQYLISRGSIEDFPRNQTALSVGVQTR